MSRSLILSNRMTNNHRILPGVWLHKPVTQGSGFLEDIRNGLKKNDIEESKPNSLTHDNGYVETVPSQQGEGLVIERPNVDRLETRGMGKNLLPADELKMKLLKQIARSKKKKGSGTVLPGSGTVLAGEGVPKILMKVIPTILDHLGVKNPIKKTLKTVKKVVDKYKDLPLSEVAHVLADKFVPVIYKKFNKQSGSGYIDPRVHNKVHTKLKSGIVKAVKMYQMKTPVGGSFVGTLGSIAGGIASAFGFPEFGVPIAAAANALGGKGLKKKKKKIKGKGFLDDLGKVVNIGTSILPFL